MPTPILPDATLVTVDPGPPRLHHLIATTPPRITLCGIDVPDWWPNAFVSVTSSLLCPACVAEDGAR